MVIFKQRGNSKQQYLMDQFGILANKMLSASGNKYIQIVRCKSQFSSQLCYKVQQRLNVHR